jgi:hypothetical protein
MSTDKIIVTHRGALLGKYGAPGLARVDAALAALVKADLKRGLATQVYAVDDAAQLKPLGAKAVTRIDNARGVKAVIDRLCLKLAPHYVLLLGAGDVIPFVALANPAHAGPEGDDDVHVPSDLPYACDAPWSTDANHYMGPTRVVGRLPDVPGATKPTLLVKLIRAAAAARTLARADVQGYFGLSAEVWQKSTALSLRNIFGDATALQLSPDAGPAWSKAQLAPQLHFINCHGGDLAPDYYGQRGAEYPYAHSATRLPGHISKGTVMAAECCYGAQLYDPAEGDGHKGIALTYLDQGAAAVFGSTTIAYGPSEGNGTADLITQQFLQQVLAGASTGRAALEARQKFAGGRTHLDPYDLKTLAQFYLLGDPSLHPVAMTAHALNRTRSFKKAFAGTGDRSVRGLRRERLQRDGKLLAQALPRLVSGSSAPAAAVEKTLTDMVRETGLPHDTVRLSFDLQGTRSAPLGGQRRIHVVKGLRPMPADPGGPQVVRLVALVATEQDGELIHVRRLHAR